MDINIDEVLRIMAEHLEAQRIIATLINRESGDIIIEGAYGVDEAERKKTVYQR